MVVVALHPGFFRGIEIEGRLVLGFGEEPEYSSKKELSQSVGTWVHQSHMYGDCQTQQTFHSSESTLTCTWQEEPGL